MDSAHWGPWFAVGCALVALALILIGALAALVQIGRIKRRASEIVPVELLARASMAQANAQRLQGTLTQIEGEIPRLRAALGAISAALRELKVAFIARP